MEIFNFSKTFPKQETYSLTDQILRSSRSVCACIAEAWRKRKYPKHFVSKLTDAEAEAEETRVWLDFAAKCEYISLADRAKLDDQYDHILAKLVLMGSHSEDWIIS